MDGLNVNNPWAMLFKVAQDAITKRNMQWAKPQESYQTPLNVPQEIDFRKWLDANQSVPPVRYFDRNEPNPGYDMRGFYMDPQRGELQGVNKSDNQIHFNDKYKTPQHETFSKESIYATPDAPHWEPATYLDKTGWQLIDKNGKPIYTEWDK